MAVAVLVREIRLRLYVFCPNLERTALDGSIMDKLAMIVCDGVMRPSREPRGRSLVARGRGKAAGG